MANVPKIRIARYTDDWEQRKLGDIADKVTEKNTKLEIKETLTNSAEFGIVSQCDFFDHSVS
ncbi:MAG: restriction endonuclease subunit S, partial [Succinivibrionaceae bacterium]|nr:restriction endonuclease subunit S [Succinivibrionaceae bacterium]